MKCLVIVESFAKCKTISKYLNNNTDIKYNVIASAGHICDLPKNQLGFSTDTWDAIYEPTKKDIISKIRTNVKDADIIYLASDPDTEGEAIANHIKNSIKDLLKDKKIYRIKFNEITKNAIINAISNPGDIDDKLVEAQETRRILDRLIGYKVSPMLWKEFNDNHLSAGRVQSVALKMCIDLMNEIIKFKLTPYWTVTGKFKINGEDFESVLYNDNNIVRITEIENIKKLFKNLSFDGKWSVDFIEKQSTKSPPPPFITTTLQQEAYNSLKMNSKKTMSIAQKLYENGLITYMRSDSVNMSNDAKKSISSYITDQFGEDHVKIRSYKSKVANSQEGHECIRITKPDKENIDFEDITEDDKKLYKLIWRRSIACLMINAEYIDIDIIITDNTIAPYRFICKKSLLIKQGFLKVLSPNTVIDDYKMWKVMKIDSIIPIEFIAEGKILEPPSMYNEIQLIKELEKNGIGRPSTYSSIIDKLFSKNYVSKGSNPKHKLKTENYIKTKNKVSSKEITIEIGGKQKDLLIPSDCGIKINNYLLKYLSQILDIRFTANMEDALDKIALNTSTKINTLNTFYSDIKPCLIDFDGGSKKELKSGFIKSKYGHCYYNADTKKYTNIESYLKWKNITMDKLSENDKKFLIKLPIKDDSGLTLHLGPYGLYYKDTKNKNIKIDKMEWNNIVSSL